jgi:hypothetical protein
MRSASIAVVIGFALAAGAAIAQDQPKEAAPGEAQPPADAPKDSLPPAGARFSFVPADGGYLRLDSMSGQVSFCDQRTAGWACQLVPDDRAALDAEIGRLQAEVGRLKAGVAQAEPPRPQAELSPRAGQDESHLRFPTREEMERARAAVERAWRHMVDMIYDFQKDVMKKH